MIQSGFSEVVFHSLHGYKPSWHTRSILHVGHCEHYTVRSEVAGVWCFSLENIQIKRASEVRGTCLTISKYTSEGAGGSVHQRPDSPLLPEPGLHSGVTLFFWWSSASQNTSGWGCITSASLSSSLPGVTTTKSMQQGGEASRSSRRSMKSWTTHHSKEREEDRGHRLLRRSCHNSFPNTKHVLFLL